MSWRTRFLWVFLVSLAVTVVGGVMGLLFQGLTPYDQELIISSAMISGYCLIAMLGSVAWTSRKQHRGILVAAGLLVASLLGWLTLVWADALLHGWVDDMFVKVSGTAMIIGVVLLHRPLLFVPTVSKWPGRWCRVIALLSGVVVALILLTLMWGDFGWRSQDVFVRGLWASMLVTFACSVAVFVFGVMEGGPQEFDDATLGRASPVELACPKCGTSVQALANRKARCPGCRLTLTVTFEEPRCGCGYLLYGIKSDTCPECGKAVPGDLCWDEDKADQPASVPES